MTEAPSTLACVACVERGRGRGNLGTRELARAQILPSPSPFNAGHAGYKHPKDNKPAASVYSPNLIKYNF